MEMYAKIPEWAVYVLAVCLVVMAIDQASKIVLNVLNYLYESNEREAKKIKERIDDLHK